MFRKTFALSFVLCSLILKLKCAKIDIDEPCYQKCLCSADGKMIRCFQFSEFEELNFIRPPAKISYLQLSPSEKLHLNDSLSLKELEFEDEAVIELTNINGLSLSAQIFTSKQAASPLELNLHLIIDDSFIYFDSLSVASIADDIKSPFFSYFSRITFLEHNTFIRAIPSLAFKNVHNLSLVFKGLDYPQNGFYVEEDPKEYSIDVVAVDFVECRFKTLDRSILSPKVFENINELVIGDEIESIQDDLFFHFKFLTGLTLNLSNLKSFITRSENLWMKHLNSNKNLLLVLYLTIIDQAREYTFENEDFCYFKNFPTQNFVLSIVQSQKDLGMSL